MSTNNDRLDATPQQPPRESDRLQANARPIETPSESPINVYGNLTPEQTHTIARAYIQRMRGLNDDEARKYAALHPDQVLPAQLHEMHRYLSFNHPDVLREIMAEPTVATALGDFAGNEHGRTTAHIGDQPPQS